jgi:tRNA threonylcarbamoyladenosine modification (KEOPS) complex  Pcc1 subunit
LTSKSCRAEITIRAGKAAGPVYSALEPDMKKLRGKNERLDMSLHGTFITFSIETDDLASLRANVNSYLRLADASLKCVESSTL